MSAFFVLLGLALLLVLVFSWPKKQVLKVDHFRPDWRRCLEDRVHF